MTYFNTPQTYKTDYAPSALYPDDYHDTKPMFALKGNYANPAQPLLQPNINTNKNYINTGSWGAARSSQDVMMFNPSIVKNGMVCYTSKYNKYPTSAKSTTRYTTRSGRIVEVSPETLTAGRKIGHDVYVSTDFCDFPDYTDRDENFEIKKAENYFQANNRFQTAEYVEPGKKAIKLKSGRIVEFEIPKPEKEISKCPTSDSNNYNLRPSQHAMPNYTGPSINQKLNFSRPPIFSESKNEPSTQAPNTIYNGMYSNSSDSEQAMNILYTQHQELQKPQNKIFNEIQKQNQNQQINQNQNTLKQENFNYKNQNQNYNQDITNRETFFDSEDMADVLYKQILRTSAIAISYWLRNAEAYKPWMKHWEILEKNLQKTNLNITKLPTNDDEIAYTLDKGEIIKFRWEDKKRYVPKDVYLYVLLHELTHESFPPSFQGHKEPFPQMLCLLCVAAYESSMLNIENIPKNIYMSNGRPITSRESIKSEILFGIEMLKEANKNNKKIVEYYDILKQYINKYS